MTLNIPPALVSTVESHGKAVATGDNQSVLADFLPDRIGQLIASADVPDTLRDAKVQSITEAGGGFFDANIRYIRPDDSWFELRSRWVQFHDGTWRVFSVRNIPETPPWISLSGPSEDGLDAPHWTGLRDGRLLLQRCRDCRTWTWGPRPICPSCHSFDTAWEHVKPVGTLFAWTRTWQPFTPEATGHLPYTVALVELPRAGSRRVLGVLADTDGVTPRIGSPVRGEIEQPPGHSLWPLIRWHLAGTQA